MWQKSGSSEVAGMAYGSCAKSLASQSSPAPLGDQKQKLWQPAAAPIAEKAIVSLHHAKALRACQLRGRASGTP